MTAFTLAHLSDVHLPPLPSVRPVQLANKRVLGYLNWKKNRHTIHLRKVLDTLVADMLARAPDQIAVTGDLVNLALEQEFAPVRQWLDSVGSPDRVTVVPGNHDAYVRSTQHRFAESLHPFLRGDEAGEGVVRFPFLRRRGSLALIGLSSAVPTAPLMATGRLGEAQLAELEQLLAQLAGEDSFRVLLIHHPLTSRSRQKWLADAPDLLALLRRYGVELVLHGHDHEHATVWVEGPNAPIPVIGVPSASAMATGHHPGAGYNLFSVHRDNDGWRCTHTIRGFGEAGGMCELGRVDLTPPR
jgi:3',5'-cyclic AMP phosphodiesterase CpdA